jgi:hypothetical protein
MPMRRLTTWFLAIAVLVVPLRASASSAVTHRDPDDFEVAPDVQLTTKQGLFVEGLGHRIRISASGDLGPRYRLRVLVDAHGDGRADVVMVATVIRLELRSCVVRHAAGATIEANCNADPQRAWWGVARRDLSPDKRIRWRIVALRGPTFGAVIDRAPDAGWYV